MRGLKLETAIKGFNECLVASFTDAWIETWMKCHLMKYRRVASFTDAWIETESLPNSSNFKYVASFTDAWIETFNTIPYVCPFSCRIFYRCVD